MSSGSGASDPSVAYDPSASLRAGGDTFPALLGRRMRRASSVLERAAYSVPPVSEARWLISMWLPSGSQTKA
jgi:hypothetical protein